MTEEVLELTDTPSADTPVACEMSEPVDTSPAIDSPQDDIAALKAEISQLRTTLEQQKESSARKINEMTEFNRLYPNVCFSQLPSEVIDRVESGIPLAAAYALYEKEQNAKNEKAGEINRKNAFLSAGKAGTQTSGEFFTPDEVRAMSPAQVHENYKKIRESMTHWRNKTFY